MEDCINSHLVVHHGNHEEPRTFPEFTQPMIIGHYSLDDKREYKPSMQQLKVLRLPRNLNNLSMNLNHGIKNAIRKHPDARDEKLDFLIRFIYDNLIVRYNNGVPKRLPKPITLNYDFVAYRGLLRLLMCSPYERRDDWCILATKFNGTIYLCQQETVKKQKERLNRSNKTKMILSYGYKFEQYILRKHDESDVNINVPVNEMEEFACVFKAKLGNFRLLYAAEMDGVESDIDVLPRTNLNSAKFIELKVKYENSANFYEDKLRNWWCQSYLVGIDKVYVGVRDYGGIVRKIEPISLREEIHHSSNFWSTKICMSFLQKFLSMVHQHMANVDCPVTVFEYYWAPNKETITYRKHKPWTSLRFIPLWYVDKMK